MHGGKREGSGRKQKPYKTKAIRVPEPCLKDIQKIIDKFLLTRAAKKE